jgi:hypothetical protein
MVGSNNDGTDTFLQFRPDKATATATTLASHSSCRIPMPDEKENTTNEQKDGFFYFHLSRS